MGLKIELTCDKCGYKEEFSGDPTEAIEDLKYLIEADDNFRHSSIYLCGRCRRDYREFRLKNTPSIEDFLKHEQSGTPTQ